MTIDDSFWQYALLLSNAFLVAAAALAVIRSRSEMRAMREFWTSPAMLAMQPEAYDDRDLRRMLDRRITMLQKYVEQKIESRDDEETGTTTAIIRRGNELPIEYAARMARAGASVEDLIRGCGLNKGEAELLMRLHAGQQSGTRTTTH